MAILFLMGRNVNIASNAELADPRDFIGGAKDYTSFLNYDSVRTQASQELKGDVFNATVWRYPGFGPHGSMVSNPQQTGTGLAFRYPPRAGDEIVIYDTDEDAITPEQRARQGTQSDARIIAKPGDAVDGHTYLRGYPLSQERYIKQYAGIVVGARFYRVGQDYEVWEVTAIDYTYILDRISITADFPYLELIAGNTEPNIDAGEQMIKVLEQARLRMFNLAKENDIYYDYMINPANLGLIARNDGIVPRIPLIRARNQLPSQIFENISSSTGYYWHIDYDMRVNFYNTSVSTAPIPQIIVSPKPLETPEYDPPTTGGTPAQEDYANIHYPQLVREEQERYERDVAIAIQIFDLEEEENIEGIATFMRMANVIQPSVTPFIDPIFIGGDLLMHDPVVIQLQHTINSNQALHYVRVMNATRDTELHRFDVSVGETPNIIFQTEIPTAGQVPANQVFVKRGSENIGELSRLYLNPSILAEGNYVEVSYTFSEPSGYDIPASDLAIDTMKARLGGTGIHEYIYSRLAGLYIEDSDQIQLLGRQFLDRKQSPMIRGSFSTYKKGWRPGQEFTRKDDLGNDGLFGTPDARGRYEETPLYVINVSKTIESPYENQYDPHREEFQGPMAFDEKLADVTGRTLEEWCKLPQEEREELRAMLLGKARVVTSIEYSNVPRGINQ